jgi:ribulose-phosphate 3-epimerase
VDVVAEIAARGAGPGLAVHPDVGLDAVERHLGRIEVLLMMTVRPGFGGQGFMHEIVPKVRAAKDAIHAAGLDVDVEVDGGVKLGNVDSVVAAGADIVVSGSGIYDGVDAPAAARRLRARLDVLAAATT